MTYYFVANIKIINPADYERYLEQVDEIFSKYKGEYLAVDPDPTILEGKWDYTKSVLIKFNSKQDFKDWYYSEEYQKILKFRLDSSTCDTILIGGLD
jgi:uncharacterized protein (DUF1330 family)